METNLIKILGVIFMTLLTSPSFSEQLVLTQNGKSEYSIIIPAQSISSERRAAEELQRFIFEISDATLPILTDDVLLPKKFISLGNTQALTKIQVNIDFKDLGNEGFVLRTVGKNLIIAGGPPRGTLYGVYTFLEKLDCRWFTAKISKIPKADTIIVPVLDEIQKPDFEYREMLFTELYDKDWAVRNKNNGNFMYLDETTGGKVVYYPFIHSFYLIVPPEKYFVNHPEYFSLINGKRTYERAQLCLTNPEVIKLATEQVLTWFKEKPDTMICSISQMDWYNPCQCENCQSIVRREEAESGVLLYFINAIAEEVVKQYPDKLIDTIAYQYTEEPPKYIKPLQNVRIRICPISCCEAHPYEQCNYGPTRLFVDRLKRWSKITDNLYIWHYCINFSNYLLPFPDFNQFPNSIRMHICPLKN